MRTFPRHYVEMLIATVLGMFVLGIPLAGLLGLAGIDVSRWATSAPSPIAGVPHRRGAGRTQARRR